MEPPPRPTSRIPLPESAVVRKGTCGRAVLHVDNSSSEKVCSSAMTQHNEKERGLFHSHALNGRVDWNAPTGIACWHCCHGYDGDSISIPSHYDTYERKYIVHGNFCSLSCAKGHIMASPTADSAYFTSLFTQMAREIYGVHTVNAAPPRVTLQMFGGPYSIKKFRAAETRATVIEAPFVTSYMVVEEKHDRSLVDVCGTVRGLRRPAPVSIVISEDLSDGDTPYGRFLAAMPGVAAESGVGPV